MLEKIEKARAEYLEDRGKEPKYLVLSNSTYFALRAAMFGVDMIVRGEKTEVRKYGTMEIIVLDREELFLTVG
ncbi:hypothetical protein D3C74_50210 [compost metagenome]